MPLTIGDVAWAIGGDLSGFNAAVDQSEKIAGQKADSIGKRFRDALSPANLLTGFTMGAGIAAFQGLTNAIDQVVGAIPNLIERGKQYGLLVDDISDATGAAAEVSSNLAGSLMALGIPTEGLSANLRILSQQVTGNEAAFTKRDIAIRDGNDVLLDTVTILDNVRHYLSGLSDGADKVTIATQLLGRSGLELIDYLNLTDDQAVALTDHLKALGLIVGEEYRIEAEKAKRETSLLDLAWLGLGVTLQAEVGPIIRQVIGGATQFMIDNAQTIREVIATVVSAISGLITGLLGIPTDGLGTFADQLAALGGTPATEIDRVRGRLAELNQQRKDLVAGAPKIAASTDGETAALDRQTAAIDKQKAAIDRREAAAQAAYEKEIGRLSAQEQKQIDLLDASERALAQARGERDLAMALAVAEEDLRKARDTTGDKTIDVAAESAARLRIAEIQAQVAEAARAKDVAAQRKVHEDTKTYLDGLVDLEKNTENRKALAKTLVRRETKLEEELAAAKARGDTEGAAQIAIKLEGVRTSEARNQAVIRAGDQKTELQKTKDELAATKAAITASIGGGSTEAQKTFNENLRKIDEDIANSRANLQSLYLKGVMARTLMGAGGGGEAPLGAGGGLSGAFKETAQDWHDNAGKMRDDIQGILDVLGAIPATIDTILTKFSDWGKWEPPQWLKDLGAIVDQLLLHTPTTEFFNKTTNPDLNPWAPKPPKTPIPPPPGGFGGGLAAGGFLPPDRSRWIGEAGVPEIGTGLPGGGAWITPLADVFSPAMPAYAMPPGSPLGSAFGGDRAVHVLHAYFDRHEIAVLLDEENAWLPQ